MIQPNTTVSLQDVADCSEGEFAQYEFHFVTHNDRIIAVSSTHYSAKDPDGQQYSGPVAPSRNCRVRVTSPSSVCVEDVADRLQAVIDYLRQGSCLASSDTLEKVSVLANVLLDIVTEEGDIVGE